jgi:hypothetical protein
MLFLEMIGKCNIKICNLKESSINTGFSKKKPPGLTGRFYNMVNQVLIFHTK